jgi:hypothetical protein
MAILLLTETSAAFARHVYVLMTSMEVAQWSWSRQGYKWRPGGHGLFGRSHGTLFAYNTPMLKAQTFAVPQCKRMAIISAAYYK